MSGHDEEVRDSYDELAADYDRRWSTYVQRSVDQTLARTDVESGDRVVDVGCGTGVLLGRLLDRRSDIEATGLDLSARMLEVARRRLPGDVELVQGEATSLPFAEKSFDVAVSSSALHYVERPQRVLEEMHRVLDDRGRVVVTDWCSGFWATRLLSRLLRWFDDAHHRTLSVGQLRDLAGGAGFRDIEIDRYKIQWQWGLMTMTARR